MNGRQPVTSSICQFAVVMIAGCLLIFVISGVASVLGESISRDSSYRKLIFCDLENIPSSRWTKSVLFNSAGTRLYTFNLEEMSIYEFECSTRKLVRKFRFEPTQATGWDYDLNKPMPSFAEKPVEGCFSHDDRLLWVSLHNAGGIVAIPMDTVRTSDSLKTAIKPTTTSSRVLYIYDAEKKLTDTVRVPFIKTGKTPKVITVTPDDRYLLVSNWHSNTVSVLRIQDSIAPYGRKVKDIRTGEYPRGIAVTGRPLKSYVTNMSSDVISVINNKSWKIERQIRTIRNPRHVIADSLGRLLISYNTSSQIACVNAQNGRVLFRSPTSANPRTIAISKNKKFLFVACYEGNTLDVFKINKGSFTRIYSLVCPDKPVGVDLREDEQRLEAWVCTYEGEFLQVFSFIKE
ncbi:YncE family protein [Flavihumibacter sp. R14]|nr:YncE family protein [Flavihumibacter soli]